MSRRGVRAALYIGNRVVLAMTCWGCGKLLPGTAFAKRRCSNGHYVSRRCGPCRWAHASINPGRSKGRVS